MLEVCGPNKAALGGFTEIRRVIMAVKSLLVPLVAALGLLVVSCSHKVPGDAANAVTATSTTNGGGSGVDRVDPCSLLKSEDVSKLRLTSPEALDSNSCQWRTADRTLIRLNTYQDKSLAELVPGPNSKISDVRIADRAAKVMKPAVSSTSCAYSVEVSEKSRVDVFASGATLDGACAAAKSVTDAVEPNLP
ncbi:hypothetical protein GCM10022247_67960 [Allokutzneria multivorans]|uniref:DUF3558 domain-containing protein n=1 Tax=Allokutzneria multivorans TaxID=1142134 RepID=A0ABP7U104_9PSEU